MINGRPPRDTRPGDPQDAPVSNPEYNLGFHGRNESVTGYSLSTNNDETESPPSLEPQVLFAFRDCFDSFPADDQICSPHESDSHAGDPFEPFLQLGRSHTPIIQLSSVVPLAFSQSDDPDGFRLPQAVQPRTDGRPLPPSQGDTLGFSAPDTPPTVVFSNNTILTTHNDNGSGRVEHYSRHEPQTFFEPSSRASRDANEGLPTESALPRDSRNPPIGGPYPSEYEQPPLVGIQNEGSWGGSSFLYSFVEESNRYGTVGPSLLNSFLTSAHLELHPRRNQNGSHHILLGHEIDTQGDAGPSSFAMGDPPGGAQDPRKGKRKRPADDTGDTVRDHLRARKGAPSEGASPTQPSIPQLSPRRRTKIEQVHYVCGNIQHNWVLQNPIEFHVNGQPGVRLTDALNVDFSDLDQRHDEMFRYPGAGSSILCRIHFPGHPRHTSQITTSDHRKNQNPRTRKKVAFEVAKCIKRYAEKIGMPYESMVLTKLVHVSKASWEPEVWCEQEPAGTIDS